MDSLVKVRFASNKANRMPFCFSGIPVGDIRTSFISHSRSLFSRVFHIAEYDYDTDIEVQREEAMRAGSHQAKLETAHMLKRLGDSLQKIMQVTGLSKEEVENV